MAFGEILRSERVKRGLTPSDVAEGTRMLVQIVEGLEKEDFRRIAAPIYGRGFIKLYAELLELDPEPLIVDFMNLYNGTRPPSVLTKKVLEPADDPAPIPTPVPVTRTVSDSAARAPQPVARPVAVKEPEVEDDAPEPPDTLFADADSDVPDAPPSFVAEPETPRDEMDDLELFQSPQRRRAPEPKPARTEQDDKPKRKFPIFQVGGRMEPKDVPEDRDEEARARLHARVQVFMDGVAKLKKDVTRRLPQIQSLPSKQMWLVGGAGLVVVTVMIIGITTLFKMTGPSAQSDAGARDERVIPPPPLYVD